MTTIGEALRSALARFAAHDSARLDAEVLLAHVLDKPRSHLHAWPEKPLSGAQATAFEALVARRAAGEPVAHLTGLREFWSLTLEVSPATLIPRPDTELLVEQALAQLPPGQALRVADLGTGSGAVALALAAERPAWTLYAVERSPACLAVAARNAARLELGLGGLLRADWCSAFAASCLDAIVSNPPYVCENDPHLAQGDVRFEPRSALVAGREGLSDIEPLSADAARVLVPGGLLLLEHAPGQTAAIHKLLNRFGYESIVTHRDLAGRERVTGARRKP